MTTTLLALHGFSQNGTGFAAQLLELSERFPRSLRLDFPDAPNDCPPESVARLRAFTKDTSQSPGPHRCFWDATDDGREYRGWEQSLPLLRARMEGKERIGLLGFSQGASVAATLCALAARGEVPKVSFAVLVAGRKPRSEALAPLFDTPLRVPSLHVWGERDGFATAHAPQLVDCFTETDREVTLWRGPHVVPTRGAASDTIAAFVTMHSTPPYTHVPGF